MSSSNGFTIIEAVVSVLIAATVVVAIGGLGERLIHHRESADSNSAAMSLAERQMEAIRNDPVPDPTATQCAASPVPALCGSSTAAGLLHGPTTMGADATGTAPFSVRWWVVDAFIDPTNSPLVRPTGVTVKSKKITVTVAHTNNPAVNATVVTYFTPL